MPEPGGSVGTPLLAVVAKGVALVVAVLIEMIMNGGVSNLSCDMDSATAIRVVVGLRDVVAVSRIIGTRVCHLSPISKFRHTGSPVDRFARIPPSN